MRILRSIVDRAMIAGWMLLRGRGADISNRVKLISDCSSEVTSGTLTMAWDDLESQAPLTLPTGEEAASFKDKYDDEWLVKLFEDLPPVILHTMTEYLILYWLETPDNYWDQEKDEATKDLLHEFWTCVMKQDMLQRLKLNPSFDLTGFAYDPALRSSETTYTKLLTEIVTPLDGYFTTVLTTKSQCTEDLIEWWNDCSKDLRKAQVNYGIYTPDRLKYVFLTNCFSK